MDKHPALHSPHKHIKFYLAKLHIINDILYYFAASFLRLTAAFQ